MESLTNPDIPGLQLTDHRDWYEPLLSKLIKERKKMPKQERLEKFRNDSVDEVDTTDLENWRMRGRYVRKVLVDDNGEPYPDEVAKEIGLSMDPGDDILGENDHRNDDVYFEIDHERELERLVLRHRLDVAKLLFGKDGGYSLRKYKRIFKREMEENPGLYYIEGKTDTWRD